MLTVTTATTRKRHLKELTESLAMKYVHFKNNMRKKKKLNKIHFVDPLFIHQIENTVTFHYNKN